MPIIAIVRGVKPEDAVAVAEVVYKAGIRVIEVPLNSPNPFLSIRNISEVFKDKMIVGAGTVTTCEEVQKLKDAGGELVVSPNTDTDVIKTSKTLGMLSYPGVMTVSECFQALNAGADGLKLFPANVVGKAFIQAAKVVLPKATKIFAVGGVDSNNMQEWRNSGVDGFGLGSSIYKPGMSLNEVAQRCEDAAAIFKKAAHV